MLDVYDHATQILLTYRYNCTHSKNKIQVEHNCINRAGAEFARISRWKETRINIVDS